MNFLIVSYRASSWLTLSTPLPISALISGLRINSSYVAYCQRLSLASDFCLGLIKCNESGQVIPLVSIDHRKRNKRYAFQHVFD